MTGVGLREDGKIGDFENGEVVLWALGRGVSFLGDGKIWIRRALEGKWKAVSFLTRAHRSRR